MRNLANIHKGNFQEHRFVRVLFWDDRVKAQGFGMFGFGLLDFRVEVLLGLQGSGFGILGKGALKDSGYGCQVSRVFGL